MLCECSAKVHSCSAVAECIGIGANIRILLTGLVFSYLHDLIITVLDAPQTFFSFLFWVGRGGLLNTLSGTFPLLKFTIIKYKF